MAARLERGPLPLRQVLGFGVEIADALEAAHRQGIVHRDLKPANVMITPGGTKLLDFGLAKNTVGAGGQPLSQLATAPGTATAQGTIIGTLQYMAPEQVQGQPADVRTDIFALGALLYEMATGRRAFEATTQASLIAKILETEPPTVSSLAPLTPPALDHVVQGCLAKAPADRWQTAHDVKMQLQWIQAQGSRVEATAPVTASRRRMAWVPWVVAAASAALAATMLVMWPGPAVTQAPPARFDLIVPARFRLNECDVRRDLSRWATVRIQRPGGRPSPSPGSARSELDRNGRHAGHGGPVAAVLVTRQPVGRVHRRPHRAAAKGPRHRRTRTDARRNGQLWSAARGRPASSCSGPPKEAGRAHSSRRGYGRDG